MNLLITLMTLTSLMFMCMMTPLTLGLMLIIQTFLVSMISAVILSSFWYSYLLILIMVSGLLIMFMYMASIASNEKFKLSLKILMVIPIVTGIMIKEETLFFNKKINMEFMLNKQELFMTKILNSKFILPSVMMIMFLFMMMVVISFIVSTKEGPMRKSN
uniref:NADH dehydrogenase subunit 6 n=1 Tax=Trachypeplus jacobsoni TaxID=2172479 RepID=A0A343WNS2_9HEMI|nr:NADH dehydrogenase subunit 6 [Trachypeplus jacobsoni]AWD31648.1 NADH dehydrogenase subunit 6 [Trachypeplus jacobsoni]